MIVAAVVYWPWFAFVDSHGGYWALLAHQRSYLGGLSSWPGHLVPPARSGTQLSGGPVWLACGGLAAALGDARSAAGDFGARLSTSRECARSSARPHGFVRDHRISWWVVAGVWSVACCWRKTRLANKSACFICVGWAAISVLTPFYHPYATALAADRGVRMAALGRAVRRDSIEMSKIGGEGPDGPGFDASDPLVLVSSLACIVGAIFSAYSSGSPWKLRHLALAGTERLAEAGITDDSGRTSAGREATCAFSPGRRSPFTWHWPAASPSGDSPTWHTCSTAGIRRHGPLLDLALIRQDNISERGFGPIARRLDGWFEKFPRRSIRRRFWTSIPRPRGRSDADASAPLRLLRRKRMEDVR